MQVQVQDILPEFHNLLFFLKSSMFIQRKSQKKNSKFKKKKKKSAVQHKPETKQIYKILERRNTPQRGEIGQNLIYITKWLVLLLHSTWAGNTRRCDTRTVWRSWGVRDRVTLCQSSTGNLCFAAASGQTKTRERVVGADRFMSMETKQYSIPEMIKNRRR